MAGKSATGEKRYEARPLVDGLITNQPPHGVPQGASPDLLNVVMQDMAVTRRSGFTSLTKERLRMNSLQNVGFSRVAREYYNDAAENVPYLKVPGMGIAGHLPIYNTIGDAFTVEFFFSPKNLVTRIGTDGVLPATTRGLEIRPILSKGPLKKTEELEAAYGYGLSTGASATDTGNGPNWTAPSAAAGWGTQSGVADTEGMPFCFYLQNINADYSNPDWRLKLSVHAKGETAGAPGDIWWLKTVVATTLPIVEDAIYHVIATIVSGDAILLRAGRVFLDGSGATTYGAWLNLLSTGAIHKSLTVAKSWCPIQVFDCPQGFIENDHTVTADANTLQGTAALRPGFDINVGTLGTGHGYFYSTRRFEGRLEDIAIWNGDKLAADLTALDRREKIDVELAGDDLVALWPMTEGSKRIITEVAGRGSDIVLSPSGPVYTERFGATPEGSWFFNGMTAFAQCDLGDSASNFEPSGNPNWRQYQGAAADTNEACFREFVENAHSWGVELVIWPASIEPNFEQVLVEFHDVLRVSLGTDGTIQVRYAIDGGANPNFYNDAAWSGTMVLQPGLRYHIAIFRSDDGVGSGNQFRIYVNGKLDLEGPSPAVNSAASNQGGLTWAIGSVERIHLDASAPPELPLAGETHSINFDHRSCFCGVIESCRLVCGAPIGSGSYKDLNLEDDQILMEQLLTTDTTTTPNADLTSHMLTGAPVGGFVGELAWNPEDTTLPSGRRERQRGFVFSTLHAQDQEFFFPPELTLSRGRLERIIRYVMEIDALPQFTHQMHRTLLPKDEGGWYMAGILRTHFKVWHTWARWDFNVSDEADEATYPGFYFRGWELRSIFDNVTPVLQGADHIYRWTHIQESGVDDQHQTLGPILRGCIESDLRREFYQSGGPSQRPGMAVVNSDGVSMLQPYAQRSPLELQPRFTQGIVRAHPGGCRVSLIADWQVPSSLERFRIVGSGRNLYWAKPPWRENTPFRADPKGSSSVWMFGQVGEFIRCESTDDTNQNIQRVLTAFNQVELDVWVYPYRLDGTRLIALKDAGTGVNGLETNYAVWSENGAVHMAGTFNGGAETWRSRSVLPTATPPAEDLPIVGLRVREWNHIKVRLDTDPADNLRRQLWVNGTLIATYDDFDTPNAVAADDLDVLSGGKLYIGGLPEGDNVRTFTHILAAPGIETVTFESWHGLISEFRQITVDDPAFPTGADGIVPRDRATADANTYYLLPLNEGDFWAVTNTAVAASGGGLRVRELILVQDNLEESSDDPYRWVVFRDRLYVTNGKSRPQEIYFTRFSDPAGPFRAHDAGVLAPVVNRGTSFHSLIATTTPAWSPNAPGSRQVGVYQVWCSFLDEDGRESEPTLIYGFTIVAANSPDTFTIRNLPRSTHPRVVGRRIYLSPNGGGNALFFKDIPDNLSRIVELHEWPTGGTGVRVGFQLPMPRAKHIAVAKSSIILGDLPDETNGANAFDYSIPEEAVYFALDNATVIDSQDGRPIIGIESHLGRTYLSKRSSIWAFAFAGITELGQAEAYLTLVNRSVGVGAGGRLFDDVIFGAGDRGVYRFNGSDTFYSSPPLEVDWKGIDTSDEGLFNMWGAFYHPDSQYLLSVREDGAKVNEVIFALHMSVGGLPEGPLPRWTKLRVPAHTYMETVTDEETQATQLLLGTDSGHILLYRDVHQSDIAAKWTYDSQTVVIEDTIQAVSADLKTLTLNGPLDELMDGLAGVKIKASGVERTVLRNTGTTVTVTQAFPTAPSGAAVIGGYKAYWTPGWLEPQRYGKGLRAQQIDLDFVPIIGGNTADLRWICARANILAQRLFDEAAAEIATVDPSTGYLKNPIALDRQVHGRYFRIQVGTEGVDKPWSLSGFGFRWFETGIFGNP